MRERKGGGPYAPTRGILLFHTRRLAFGVVFFLLRQHRFFVRPHDNDIDDVSGTQLLGFRFEPLFLFLRDLQFLREFLLLLREGLALFLQVIHLLRQMILPALKQLLQWIAFTFFTTWGCKLPVFFYDWLSSFSGIIGRHGRMRRLGGGFGGGGRNGDAAPEGGTAASASASGAAATPTDAINFGTGGGRAGMGMGTSGAGFGKASPGAGGGGGAKASSGRPLWGTTCR